MLQGAERVRGWWALQKAFLSVLKLYTSSAVDLAMRETEAQPSTHSLFVVG